MVLKRTAGETAFDVFNWIFLTLLALICLYPMLYVVFNSFSDPIELMKHQGGALFWPLGYSLEGYKAVFQSNNIRIGYMNTAIYVAGGTALSVFFTALGAYVLSTKTRFLLKKPMMVMVVITMYFGGGLIPSYMLVRNIGLYDTRWAVIIPGLISTFNMIVMRTAFVAVPESLKESARIDGANDFIILFKIVLPVAKATLAVMILFYAVGQWNSWFNAMIYLNDQTKWPVQMVLRQILTQFSDQTLNHEIIVQGDDINITAFGFRCAVIVVVMVPMLCVYPFIQRYFIKGIMIGSLKG